MLHLPCVLITIKEAAVVRNDPGCDEHAEEGYDHGDQEADGGCQVSDGGVHGDTGQHPGQPHQASQQAGHTRTPSLYIPSPGEEHLFLMLQENLSEFIFYFRVGWIY